MERKKTKVVITLSIILLLIVTLNIVGLNKNNVKTENLSSDYIAYETPSTKIAKYITKTIEVNQTFATETEANDFIENVKAKENVKNVNMAKEATYSEWKTQSTEKVEEVDNLTQIDRDNYVKEKKQSIENESTDTTKYIITSKDTSKSEEVFVEEEVTDKGELEFDDEESANSYIASLKNEETDKIRYEIEGPTVTSKYVKTETTEFAESFDTAEERENYINSLEEYTLSDIKKYETTTTITNKVETNNIIIKNSNKLDKNNNYQVEGNYLMIKQASGNVAIWTLTELNDNQKESFKNNWLNGHYDGSVDSDYNFHFIYGEGTHDLSYIGKQWTTYTISASENTITMTCDSSNISHLNYGIYEKETKDVETKITKYNIEGKKSKDIYKDVYVVSYQKYEKRYETKTTYGAEIYKETLVRDKFYIVSGSYDEINTVYEEVQTPEENKQVLNTFKAEKIMPPYTGDTSKETNILFDLLVLSLVTILIPLKKELEN